jgi:hypothetical protein
MNRLRPAFLAITILAPAMTATLPAGYALAQGTSEERAACSPDVRRLCKSAGDDTFVVLACLKQNRAKLSKACEKVLADNGQ